MNSSEGFVVRGDSNGADILRFGAFQLHPRSGEIWRDGRRIKLQEQPFQLLRILLERSGQLVTRDELRTELWPQEAFIDFDHSLAIAVNKLRAALGDSVVRPLYVETLRRRGYRFLQPVERGRSSLPPACEASQFRR